MEVKGPLFILYVVYVKPVMRLCHFLSTFCVNGSDESALIWQWITLGDQAFYLWRLKSIPTPSDILVTLICEWMYQGWFFSYAIFLWWMVTMNRYCAGIVRVKYFTACLQLSVLEQQKLSYIGTKMWHIMEENWREGWNDIRVKM